MMAEIVTPPACFWCGEDCGGTCLGLTKSAQMNTTDPAYWMLNSGHVSSTTIHRDSCYICRDPEFAQMGMPLCQPCPRCTEKAGQDAGHIAADDFVCDDCEFDAQEAYEQSLTETQSTNPG